MCSGVEDLGGAQSRCMLPFSQDPSGTLPHQISKVSLKLKPLILKSLILKPLIFLWYWIDNLWYQKISYNIEDDKKTSVLKNLSYQTAGWEVWREQQVLDQPAPPPLESLLLEQLPIYWLTKQTFRVGLRHSFGLLLTLQPSGHRPANLLRRVTAGRSSTHK